MTLKEFRENAGPIALGLGLLWVLGDQSGFLKTLETYDANAALTEKHIKKIGGMADMANMP